jgi:hypothetical protein
MGSPNSAPGKQGAERSMSVKTNQATSCETGMLKLVFIVNAIFKPVDLKKII